MSYPPFRLIAFVTVLGVAVQVVASLLAVQATSPWTMFVVSFGGTVIALVYACLVSYRRGYEAATADGPATPNSIQNPKSEIRNLKSEI